MPYEYNPFTNNLDDVGAENPADVVGPGGPVTEDSLARWDGTSGTMLKDSSAILDDSGNLTVSSIALTTSLAVGDGGTGASTASGARTSLGLEIGTDVQAWDTQLDDIAALAVTNGNFIVGDGSNWVVESGATARTSLGLGSIATQDFSSVTITGGSITGITDLAVADGGTGRGTATSYAVICGGPIATGAHQSVASVGTSGQVLTSNGAGSLPTFQDAGGGGAWELISSSTASSSSSITFTDLSNTYYVYQIVAFELIPETDGERLLLRTSANNGSSYDSGSSDYMWSSNWSTTGGSGDGDESDSSIQFVDAATRGETGNGTNEQISLTIDVFNPSSTKITMMKWAGQNISSAGEAVNFSGSGHRASAAAVDAIQLLFSADTIASGTFKLYGLKAS